MGGSERGNDELNFEYIQFITFRVISSGGNIRDEVIFGPIKYWDYKWFRSIKLFKNYTSTVVKVIQSE